MIHPDFFTDERVVAVSMAAQKLFIGLWCWADREGRLERNPLRLKMQIFPAEVASVADLLAELESVGLVLSYVVGGRDYLLVCGFAKRQRPHMKEAKSELPAPPTRMSPERVGAEHSLNAASPGVVGGGHTSPDLGSTSDDLARQSLSESESESESESDLPPRALSPESVAPERQGAGELNLRERMERAWMEETGAAYAWRSSDDLALGAVLPLAKNDWGVIERVWRVAATGFPTCSNVATLAKHWNAYAAASAKKSKPEAAASQSFKNLG